MNLSRTILHLAIPALAALAPLSLQADPKPDIKKSADGGTEITFQNGQKVTLPTSRDNLDCFFTNADGTLNAFDEATSDKTNAIRIYFKNSAGSFSEIKDVNQMIQKADPSISEQDAGGIRLIYLIGRTLDISTLDHRSFKIQVDQDGAIKSRPDGGTTPALPKGQTVTFQAIGAAGLLTLPNGQTFTLSDTTGILGPVWDSTSQVPFANADASVVALNDQPARETSFINIYLKGSDGKFTEIKDVNDKIRAADPANVGKYDTEFIRVDRVEGRVLDVSTMEFTVPPIAQTFSIEVSPAGEIKHVDSPQ